MFEYVSDISDKQTGHMQKMTVHQNITAFKETRVFTQGNISEHVHFQKIHQQHPFLITICYIGLATHGEIFIVAIHVPKLKPYKGELPSGGNKFKPLF